MTFGITNTPQASVLPKGIIFIQRQVLAKEKYIKIIQQSYYYTE